MDKTAQATPTKEWIDYRVRVKHFPKHLLFPVTLLAEKQAGRGTETLHAQLLMETIKRTSGNLSACEDDYVPHSMFYTDY